MTTSDKTQQTKRIDRRIKKQERGKTQESRVSGEVGQAAWQPGDGQSATAIISLSPDPGR